MSNTPGALIAMSGGVDSTVAAYLMKQAGCRCMGATMRLYQNEDLGQSGFHTCCSAKDVEDAAEVAFQLDIPFEVVNYTEEFREKVIAKFIETYEAGGTPNPCIDCNRTMKFDKMLDFAREATRYVPHVVLTIVDKDKSSEEIETCRQIAAELGVKLRIRSFIDS